MSARPIKRVRRGADTAEVRTLPLAAAAALAILAFLSAPASATSPGQNGRIAFAGEGGQIQSALPSGDDRRTLFADAGTSPSFSANAAKVAYTSFDGLNHHVVIRDTDGGGTPVVIDAPPEQPSPPNTRVFVMQPVVALSPDAQLVAYVVDVVDIQGLPPFGHTSGLAVLVHNANGEGDWWPIGGGTDPTFTPNGQSVVYAAGEGSAHDIAMAPAAESQAGGPQTTIVDHPGDELAPDVSPDGSRLVYQRDSGGGDYDIWTAPFQADATFLAAPNYFSPLLERHPVFSPDGTRIAYDRPEGIFIGDALGGNAALAISDPAANPAWAAAAPPFGAGGPVSPQTDPGDLGTVRKTSHKCKRKRPHASKRKRCGKPRKKRH